VADLLEADEFKIHGGGGHVGGMVVDVDANLVGQV